MYGDDADVFEGEGERVAVDVVGSACIAGKVN